MNVTTTLCTARSQWVAECSKSLNFLRALILSKLNIYFFKTIAFKSLFSNEAGIIQILEKLTSRQ